ncbi:type II secretion system F family protein [Fictibacillus phosphorivorans]|uniref:type II secretion system F family protein n=1 Tax=Fictibacillus phosphorivorans TaxID=1221500 RepID=UPI00203D78D7|nr:type II secretion system F family protein [Fictibacillus phosphorivorans]MCM3719809.1 type II secretion system F family protein [Fictibacillus phosphorivorans]MCM3777520.1 type II secretion system F family protein [Fictibacillus phosphorivorans]
MIPSILFSLSVLLFIIGFYQYLGFRSQKKELKQKISKFFPVKKRKSIIVVWGSRFDQTELAKPINDKLQKASVPLTASELLGALIVGCLGVTVLLTNLFDVPLRISFLLGLFTAALSYWLLFLIRQNRYNDRLNSQLSEVCRLLGNSARAGMTINQGIEMVAREASSPAREEFSRIASELRLGVDFEKAMRDLQNRIPSREFQLFIATLLIQKKSGGNLFSVLDEMANTLEERKVLNQTIKTMTAEQRYISYFVPALPILLLLIMNQIVDGFLEPLSTIPGIILGTIFILGTGVTFILVKKVTNIKV